MLFPKGMDLVTENNEKFITLKHNIIKDNRK